MDSAILFLCFSVFLLSLATACHALLYKRDPLSALVWVGVNLFIPLLGPFFYWCLGINRISRRARSWQQMGRRLSIGDIHPHSEAYKDSIATPLQAAYFDNLRILADRVTHTRLRRGNSIEILTDGEEAYPAMLAAISKATESINLSSYIFDADGIGADFVEELKAASERGVQVRVIIDAMGEKYSHVYPRKMLADSKVMLVRYLPLSKGAYINLRNHRKLLIIDGKEAFTGGMNIRSRHQTSQTSHDIAIHDLHFYIKGAVVADLQGAFLGDWYFVTGEKLKNRIFFPPLEPSGNSLIRSISDGPDKDFRKLEQIIMGGLACARKSVLIMTPYFIPDRSMISALITTVLRGVDVRIVLPGLNNLPFVQWATAGLLWELLANGIRVYYQPPPFVHTKLFLADDIWCMVGSANIDYRSLRLNFELNLSVIDVEFAGKVKKHFDKAISVSHEITSDEMNNLSLPVKLRNNLIRLLSPYL